MSKKAILQTDGTWKIEDFTAEEETDLEASRADIIAKKKAAEDAATKKATDAAAGKAKLKELGLTDDQITALIG
tara:strand:+ start:1273 stop:1494 length:222 start_codon:yes stop_codon:yes gene_type:complete